jgi:hypothetical protein
MAIVLANASAVILTAGFRQIRLSLESLKYLHTGDDEAIRGRVSIGRA